VGFFLLSFRVRIRKGRVPFNPTDVSGFPERRRMQTMAEERERERKETKYKCLVKKHMKKKKMNEKNEEKWRKNGEKMEKNGEKWRKMAKR